MTFPSYCINTLAIVMTSILCFLGRTYSGLTVGWLLLRNFSVAISVSPHICLILVLILISVFLS